MILRRIAVMAALGLAVRAVDAATKAGAPFLNSPLSVRQTGMGGVSIGGDDTLRAWSNPALLIRQDRKAEIALNAASLFQGVQQAFGAGGGWRVSPGFAVGVLASALTVNFSEVDAVGNTVAGLEQRSVAGGLVAARRFSPVTVGVTAKYVSETGGKREVGSLSALAADVGLSADWRDWSFGAAVRNIGGLLKGDDGITPGGVPLPAEQRVGLSYGMPAVGLLAAAEYVNNRVGEAGGAGVGAEWRPAGVAAVRLGASGFGGDVIRLSCGISVEVRGVGVDYALATHPLGLTHRFSVLMGWGMTAVSSGPEEAYRRAVELYGVGDYAGALERLRAVTGADPTNWQAWQMAGNCRYSRGDREGAIADYRRSLAINPDNGQLRGWLEQIER
jgi:hypothetical protein